MSIKRMTVADLPALKGARQLSMLRIESIEEAISILAPGYIALPPASSERSAEKPADDSAENVAS